MMQRWWLRARRQDGFTLIELIVVVAMLGILAAVVTPRVLNSVDSAKANSALAFGKEVQLALERYYLDNGSYPDDADTGTTDLPNAGNLGTYADLVRELEGYLTLDPAQLGQENESTSSFAYNPDFDNDADPTKVEDYEMELYVRESGKTVYITPGLVTLEEPNEWMK